MAGITDVARLAGVSPATVSRVLNGIPYPVAEKTRKRVLEAAQRLNYSASALARALVTRRSHIVGVLVGDIADPYFAEIVSGVEEVARQAGHLVMLCNTDRNPEIERRYVATLTEYRPDALIFVGGDITGPKGQRALAAELARARQHGIRALALVGTRGRLPSINIDHRLAAYEMTKHLLSNGHVKIGFIGGPRRVSSARERERGFRQAMMDAGAPEDMVVEGDFTYESGVAAATQLFMKSPSAIFAANDQMALGALNAARGRGWRVPKDISVVGFGDTRPAQMAEPPLTTVSVPHHMLGSMAMHAILVALTMGGQNIESRTLPYRLLIRASSGPPRSARD